MSQDRREPFTPVEKMQLDEPTSDHAIVLKVLDDDWMSLHDTILTLSRRDHRWTPDKVRGIVADLFAADMLASAGYFTLAPNLVKYRRKHRA